MRKSPNEWFEIWRRIVVDKKEVTRLELSTESECSIWTIKALARDFCNSTEHIIYRNGKFVFQTPEPLALTLSTLSDEDKEKLV